MKRRVVTADDGLEPETWLYQALLELHTVEEMRQFFHDLCTPAELEALTDRWRVVPWLLRGAPYREIHDHTGVSVTTIGRVARFLTQGNRGYRTAAERLGLEAEIAGGVDPPAAATGAGAGPKR